MRLGTNTSLFSLLSNPLTSRLSPTILHFIFLSLIRSLLCVLFCSSFISDQTKLTLNRTFGEASVQTQMGMGDLKQLIEMAASADAGTDTGDTRSHYTQLKLIYRHQINSPVSTTPVDYPSTSIQTNSPVSTTPVNYPSTST